MVFVVFMVCVVLFIYKWFIGSKVATWTMPWRVPCMLNLWVLIPNLAPHWVHIVLPVKENQLGCCGYHNFTLLAFLFTILELINIKTMLFSNLHQREDWRFCDDDSITCVHPLYMQNNNLMSFCG